MPHPVTLIIGTTMAVAASGYAFKKFIYDPHLAPLVEAFIAAHTPVRERRRHHGHAYESIAVQGPERNVAEASGRSPGITAPQLRRRMRRPSEMYELDEGRVIPDERFEPPQYAVHSPSPTKRTRPLPHSPPLVSLASIPHYVLPRMPSPVARELAPMAGTSKAPVARPLQVDTSAQPLEEDSAPATAVPATVARESPVTARPLSPGSPDTIIVNLSFSPPMHPAPLQRTGASTTSLLDSSAADSDVDLISVASGTTTSYIDAESYTPRTLSPSTTGGMSPPIALSRTLSAHSESPDLLYPGLTVAASGSQQLQFPGEGATSLGMAYLSGRQQRGPQSVSSWADDEHWRSGSDSEWAVLSDAGASA